MGTLKSLWSPALLFLLTVEVAVLALVWFSARGSANAFPQTLLTAEGLVLTALVFFLGLGQANLQRVGERVLTDLKQFEEALRDSYEDSEAMSTFRLLEWAAVAAREAKSAREATTVGWAEAWGLTRGHASLVRKRGMISNAAMDIYRIEQELHRAADDADAPRRRRRRLLVRERRKLEAQHARAVSDNKTVEHRTGISGEAVLSGRVRLAFGSAAQLLMLVFAFVSVMALLGAIGIVYSGWSTAGSPRPEVWAVASLLAVAISYAVVVGKEIRRESTATLEGLEGSWLASLYRAEELYWVLGNSAEMSSHFRAGLLNTIGLHLGKAERVSPAFPWLLSLRGRAELFEAVETADALPSERSGASWAYFSDQLERSLYLAEPLLRQGARRRDDPVAMVALARALELRASLRHNDAAKDSAEADELVEAAVLQLGMHRLTEDYLPEFGPVHGPSVAWHCLKRQPWLWPAEGQRASALQALRAHQ